MGWAGIQYNAPAREALYPGTVQDAQSALPLIFLLDMSHVTVTVVWVDCRCFLSIVFLGGARLWGFLRATHVTMSRVQSPGATVDMLCPCKRRHM